MSTLLWIFVSIISHFGVKAEVCHDRSVVVGGRCKSSGPEETYEFVPLTDKVADEITNSF